MSFKNRNISYKCVILVIFSYNKFCGVGLKVKSRPEDWKYEVADKVDWLISTKRDISNKQSLVVCFVTFLYQMTLQLFVVKSSPYIYTVAHLQSIFPLLYLLKWHVIMYNAGGNGMWFSKGTLHHMQYVKGHDKYLQNWMKYIWIMFYRWWGLRHQNHQLLSTIW